MGIASDSQGTEIRNAAVLVTHRGGAYGLMGELPSLRTGSGWGWTPGTLVLYGACMAANWPEMQKALRDVWTDDTLVRRVYDDTPMIREFPPETRRQRVAEIVRRVRTALAVRIAPWLDDYDDWS